MDRKDFQPELFRLFRAFNRPEPKAEHQLALFNARPHWLSVEKLREAVTKIIAEEDVLPANIMRAIRLHCFHNPSDKLVASSHECSPMDAARNRNRYGALRLLNAQPAGHELRDQLIALEGAALMKSGITLDWRDSFTQRRYKPVLATMEELYTKLTLSELLDALQNTLDQACERMPAA